MGHFQLGVAFQQKAALSRLRASGAKRHDASQLSEAWRALGANALQDGDWKELEPIADQLKTIAPRSAEAICTMQQLE